MDKLVIQGGQRLLGSVKISGSKNAALPILCATLLTQDPVELKNIPKLKDIHTLIGLLRSIGVTIEWTGESDLFVCAGNTISPFASYELVRTMRASVLVLGPLLARFGEAKVSLPGGCAIGARPVDQHIKGFSMMGTQIDVEGGYICATAKKLSGARILTDMVTVTGTENLLMAATLAEGETVIENAAREPEIVDLANFLISMGAQIEGAGSDAIKIRGKQSLHGTSYSIMADRIETGTYLCAGAITGGMLCLQGTSAQYLDAVIDKLTQMGCDIISRENEIVLQAPEKLESINVHTAPYPGFPTDMQAQFMALNTVAQGVAIIKENIFENRFMHAVELMRLGANIQIDGKTAIVIGRNILKGATVMATDLRASASLVLAGLAATGETIVDRIYHLDRGYEQLENKLQEIGAFIERAA